METRISIDAIGTEHEQEAWSIIRRLAENEGFSCHGAAVWRPDDSGTTSTPGTIVLTVPGDQKKEIDSWLISETALDFEVEVYDSDTSA